MPIWLGQFGLEAGDRPERPLEAHRLPRVKLVQQLRPALVDLVLGVQHVADNAIMHAVPVDIGGLQHQRADALPVLVDVWAFPAVQHPAVNELAPLPDATIPAPQKHDAHPLAVPVTPDPPGRHVIEGLCDATHLPDRGVDPRRRVLARIFQLQVIDIAPDDRAEIARIREIDGRRIRVVKNPVVGIGVDHHIRARPTRVRDLNGAEAVDQHVGPGGRCLAVQIHIVRHIAQRVGYGVGALLVLGRPRIGPRIGAALHFQPAQPVDLAADAVENHWWLFSPGQFGRFGLC